MQQLIQVVTKKEINHSFLFANKKDYSIHWQHFLVDHSQDFRYIYPKQETIALIEINLEAFFPLGWAAADSESVPDHVTWVMTHTALLPDCAALLHVYPSHRNYSTWKYNVIEIYADIASPMYFYVFHEI